MKDMKNVKCNIVEQLAVGEGLQSAEVVYFELGFVTD